MSELLVVAGEASGDRAAAQVVAELRASVGPRVFGMGEARSRRRGWSW